MLNILQQLAGVKKWTTVVASTSFLMLSFLSSAEVTAAPMYTLTTTLLGFNAWAMNENGQVAGWGNVGAQVYTPGKGVANLPQMPGTLSSNAYAINEKGQVGGLYYYRDANGALHDAGFVYSPGSEPSLTGTNVPVGIGYVISEDGIVSHLTGPVPSWSVHTFNTTARAGGYSVGYSYFTNNNDYGKAWRYNPDGAFTEIGDEIGTPQSQAYGVNAFGVVVGRAIRANYQGGYAFSYLPNIGAINLFDATDPTSRVGWTSFFSAQDITNDGRIIGFGSYSSRDYFGTASFILTPVIPVPEPGSFVLVLIGTAALYFLRKRRGR